MTINAVIMAGGSGTRLWPLSRAKYPKQFLDLQGTETMLQNTVNRLSGLDLSSVTTICNEEHRFLAAEQLRAIDKLGTIILEPVSRNTAPAIALAALASKDDPILLVLPADHNIKNNALFTEAINKSIPYAEKGKLVTFGIVPDSPNTGFGYIECGNQEGHGFKVNKFIEKPSEDDAKTFVASKDYLWNSGMFIFRASSYLIELKKFSPDIYNACKNSLKGLQSDLDFLRIDQASFASCPSNSIDYAVMEKTSDGIVVPLDAGWNDIGSWSSLWEVSPKDKDGNVLIGDVVSHKSSNSYLNSKDRLLSVVGIEDLVVIVTKDAVLVADKKSVQDVKLVAEELKKDFRREFDFHREVYRPWGKFDSLDNGNNYQVKRITVKPRAKLSVQMHHHRSEHWVVVSGVANVRNGDNTFLMSENESTYIPVGTIHSLENPGDYDLELIEVQTGTYLGEDDIVRFDDIYGRVE